MNPPTKSQAYEITQDIEGKDKAASADADTMSRWKGLIVEGNTAFDCNDFGTARDPYRRACALADTAFIDWVTIDSDNALAALVVSYLNLADTEARLCEIDAAACHLRQIHERLLTLFESVNTDAALRSVAFRHANETFRAITHFQVQHGPRKELSVFGALSRVEH